MGSFSVSGSQFPLGFRFHPTDQELIIHYLRKKVTSSMSPVTCIIADVYIYKFNPWELPDKACFGKGEWSSSAHGIGSILMDHDPIGLLAQDTGRQQVQKMMIQMQPDLDDTLYPLSTGLANAVLKNIGDYMVEKLGIDRSKIGQLCDLLYKNYVTTMAGLRAIGYSFNYDDYYSFVHGRLPYENLKPNHSCSWKIQTSLT